MPGLGGPAAGVPGATIGRCRRWATSCKTTYYHPVRLLDIFRYQNGYGFSLTPFPAPRQSPAA